jgi:hypothetical protein
MVEKKSIAEISIDTRLLYNRISSAKPGEIITYAELSEIIGKRVQAPGAGYGYLRTAIKRALSNDGLVFSAVRNEGIKRLTDEENAQSTGSQAINKIRRLSGVAIKKVTSVDFAGLSNDAKTKHNMSLSVLGLFNAFSKPRKVKKIERKFAAGILSINKTIDLFNQQGGAGK